MDEKIRRTRVATSAMLLALGILALAVSMSLPGVTKEHDGRTLRVDGWTCAISYAPTGANNVFLAASFVPWALAVWFRSVWARHLGAIFAAVTVALFTLVGVWPGFEGITHLRSGYYVWLASSIAVLASFLVLPAPERLAPDEPLPREETDRGRARLAAMFGAGATVVLLVTHLLVPTVVSSYSQPGDWESDRTGTYESGPFTTTSGPSTQRIPRPDGTFVERKWHSVNLVGPVVTAQFRRPATASHEFALLTMPLLFAAALATRRRVWRWTGAAVAAATGIAAVAWVGVPWIVSSWGKHPLEIVWWGTPPAFLAAFLLLPPARVRPA